MDHYISATILGVVEGLTEFLPVSSTGHLIIAGHLIDFTGPKADSFEVIIQLGAILAVVAIYWRRFVGLVVPRPGERFSGLYGLWLLFLTSLPASLLGLAAHDYIKAYLFTPTTVALALAVGAAAILYVESRPKTECCGGLDDITPGLAICVGCFQCLALWPGFSRSASTIMGGMLCGMDRRTAAEYSFIAAVPIMVAATGYDFYKNCALFSPDDLQVLAVGFVISFIAAFAAVKTFIALLGKMTLRPFAWYRFAVAAAVLLFWRV